MVNVSALIVRSKCATFPKMSKVKSYELQDKIQKKYKVLLLTYFLYSEDDVSNTEHSVSVNPVYITWQDEKLNFKR